jgi:hypothetical protein
LETRLILFLEQFMSEPPAAAVDQDGALSVREELVTSSMGRGRSVELRGYTNVLWYNFCTPASSSVGSDRLGDSRMASKVNVEGGGSYWAVTRLDIKIGLIGFRTRDLSRTRSALCRPTGKEWMLISDF